MSLDDLLPLVAGNANRQQRQKIQDRMRSSAAMRASRRRRNPERDILCAADSPSAHLLVGTESAGICAECLVRPPGGVFTTRNKHRLGTRGLPSRLSSVLTSAVDTYGFWERRRRAAASGSMRAVVRKVPPPVIPGNSFSALQADLVRVRTVLEFYAARGGSRAARRNWC